MLVLNGYDSSDGNAASIVVPYLNRVTIYNTSSVDVTSALITAGVLTGGESPVVVALAHAWIANLANALAVNITEKWIAMSEAQNAGETPICFARIEDSATGTPLARSDISSVVLTIYTYLHSSIRSSGTSKTPVSSTWTSVSIDVSDCITESVVTNDPRVSFGYNFKFEPNTLSNNPFANAGNYSIEFTITPTVGNKIPLVFAVSLK